MLAWHYYIRQNQVRHWLDHRAPVTGTTWTAPAAAGC
ncbi:hypothetical protein [Micromonospora sp. WMMD737]